MFLQSNSAFGFLLIYSKNAANVDITFLFFLVALSLQYYTVSTYLCLFLLQTGPCGHEPCVNTDQPIKFRRRILCS